MKNKRLITLAIVFIIIIGGIGTKSDLAKDSKEPTQQTELDTTPTPEIEIKDSEEPTQQTEIDATTTPKIEIMKQRHTTLSGIDADPESGAYGELVVPKINIWENPGPTRGKVTGTISHNTEVEILDEESTDQKYFKVKTPDGLIGWVSELFTTEIIEK